jgi:hypothetical protein
MAPFRRESVERVQRELGSVEIVNVPGTHMDFLFTARDLSGKMRFKLKAVLATLCHRGSRLQSGQNLV